MASAGRQGSAKRGDAAAPGGEPARYRQESARCRALAEASHDPEICRQWLSLCESYLVLAEAAEIIETSANLAGRAGGGR